MAGSGLISLQTGIAMALGANIGTCATAALAAIGKPTDAQRAAVIHILFNVVGALIWVSLIDVLADMSRLVSPEFPHLSSMERLAAETPRQIANANTLFNVLNTAILIGFSGILAKIAIRLVPERAQMTHHFVKPRFLDDDLIATPSLALQCARFEFGHLGGYLIDMMQSVKAAILRRDQHSLDAMRTLDDRVDMLFTDIMEYLAKIRRKQLSTEESQRLEELFIASNNVEAAGDIISERLTEIGEDWIASGRQPSETTQHILESLHETVSTAVVNAICAVRDNDKNAAEAVISLKSEVLRLVADAYAFQSNRITVANPQHLETLRTEMELVESLRQIYSLTRRIAHTVLTQPFVVSDTQAR
jgi:phosphate:Na+ symporter